MTAIVTKQFRIQNASNFVDSVTNENNSYYVFMGLTNPSDSVKFGRTSDWNTSPPVPIDNFSYMSHYRDTILFGKKITTSNIRRVVRKVDWTVNNFYDLYRHDYDLISNPGANSQLGLYDSNYYVMTDDYRVYICIDNGSSVDKPKGEVSRDKPSFTVKAVQAAGVQDNYLWKYLFTVNPSDIIKFDSTEYIVLPNDWGTSTDSEISRIRDDVVNNPDQIKKIYIQDRGSNYTNGSYTVDILGDGTGGTANIIVENGKITSADVGSGGEGYTYAIVDLSPLGGSASSTGHLIPIIPPSKGHGYDIYTELGADKVLIYARFDNSTKDFPVDTEFSQIGILKNPLSSVGSDTIYTANDFSALHSVKLLSSTNLNLDSIIGDEIYQTKSNGDVARGYLASYDTDTKVAKYYQDRSLYLNQTTGNNQDPVSGRNRAKVVDFESVVGTTNEITFSSQGNATIDSDFGTSETPQSSIVVGSKQISLGVNFEKGLAPPEINKKSGEIIYICLLYTSPSPRDKRQSRMPSSA